MNKRSIEKKSMDLFNCWSLFPITILFKIDRFYKMKKT